MFSFNEYKKQWTSNIKGDLLSGLVVALALIPEAIAFSVIAGVDPKVGLYASFSIAVLVAITGGRPGMISAATAATARATGDVPDRPDGCHPGVPRGGAAPGFRNPPSRHAERGGKPRAG